MNEVVLNKKVSIERCIRQINDYYRREAGKPFQSDYLRQDALAMNLPRAAELTIDIANHLIKTKKLGLPRESKESFALLESAGLIDAELMKRLQGMDGTRDILVHAYKPVDMNIMIDVIEHRICDLLEFADIALQRSK